MNNFFKISGSLGSNTLSEFHQFLQQFSDSLCENDTVDLLISSLGGDLQAVLSMIDLFEVYKDVTINTIALGKISSAAVVLFLAGNVRKISKNSTMTIHEPFVTFDEHSILRLRDVIYHHDKLEWYNKKIFEIFEKTNVSIDNLKEHYNEGEWFVTAEEAIKLGIATGFYI